MPKQQQSPDARNDPPASERPIGGLFDVIFDELEIIQSGETTQSRANAFSKFCGGALMSVIKREIEWAKFLSSLADEERTQMEFPQSFFGGPSWDKFWGEARTIEQREKIAKELQNLVEELKRAIDERWPEVKNPIAP